MFKNLKIGVRLAISYAIMALITVAVALVALTGFSGTQDDMEDFMTYSFAADNAVKLCQIEINATDRGILQMLVDKDTAKYIEYKNQVQTNIQQLNENIKSLEAAYTTDDGLIDSFKTNVEQWMAIAENIVLQIDDGRDEVARRMILSQSIPVVERLVEISDEISANTTQMRDVRLAESENNVLIYRVLVFSLLILSCVFCFVIAISTTKGIVNPVLEVEKAAKALSNGVLNAEIKYEAKDEIGVMAQSMRESMNTMATYISDIANGLAMMEKGDFNISGTISYVGDFERIEQSFISFSVKMSQVIEQLGQSSNLVESGSQTVSETAQQLSQGATEQAASVEQLTAIIEEISEKIKKTAENTADAKHKSDATAEKVIESNQRMNEMISAMDKINVKSAEISKIIKTIEDIAFQTNILALNAAVEAARAGAAGKGFAVVADEVRNLAQKSAEAANNTTTLISETVSAVENGTVIASQTASALQSVVEGASVVTGIIDEIQVATGEQASSISQIYSGIEQISEVVQTNSASSQETAASAEELSGQAHILRNLVAMFKPRVDLYEILQSQGGKIGLEEQ